MNEMLDYVKALSDPDRLRIIGLLSQGSATREEIAARLNLSPKDSLTHLGFLEFVGVVNQTDGVFTLNNDKLATLGKEKLVGGSKKFVPPENWMKRRRRSCVITSTPMAPSGRFRSRKSFNPFWII
jgi:DNA-binding transcriptional ArsR family regulator